MKIYTDDDLRRIDRTWLGPPNRRLPWVASYRQYVTILLVGMIVFSSMLWLGLPMAQLEWLLVWGVVTYLTVRFVEGNYRDDVGIVSNFVSAFQEVTTPRGDSGGTHDERLRMKAERFRAMQYRELDKKGKAILRQRVRASQARSLRDRMKARLA